MAQALTALPELAPELAPLLESGEAAEGGEGIVNTIEENWGMKPKPGGGGSFWDSIKGMFDRGNTPKQFSNPEYTRVPTEPPEPEPVREPTPPQTQPPAQPPPGDSTIQSKAKGFVKNATIASGVIGAGEELYDKIKGLHKKIYGTDDLNKGFQHKPPPPPPSAPETDTTPSVPAKKPSSRSKKPPASAHTPSTSATTPSASATTPSTPPPTAATSNPAIAVPKHHRHPLAGGGAAGPPVTPAVMPKVFGPLQASDHYAPSFAATGYQGYTNYGTTKSTRRAHHGRKKARRRRRPAS